MSNSPVSIACFGECLWDILPGGIFLGGAPLNVAYHLSRHGIRTTLVSAVGRDFLGDEALSRIAAWGISTEFIARHRRHPTGTVRATLIDGVASYEIASHVAWDHIRVRASLRKGRAPDALVFGSLALRDDPNRIALIDLLAAWPHALRVVDINLRPPFDTGAGLNLVLGHAQIVKMNDLELAQLTNRSVASVDDIQAAAREFAQHHLASRICITAGNRGAGLLWQNEWFWEQTQPVLVRDTVGTGDAFLAELLSAVVGRQSPLPEALRAACRMAEFVAARDGATPPYEWDERGPRESSTPNA